MDLVEEEDIKMTTKDRMNQESSPRQAVGKVQAEEGSIEAEALAVDEVNITKTSKVKMDT